MALTGSEDPESSVVLVIHLTQGGQMVLRTQARTARHAIREWKKYVHFMMTPELERGSMDLPMFMFHFLCANLENDICGSFLMQNVSAIHYLVEEEKKF